MLLMSQEAEDIVECFGGMFLKTFFEAGRRGQKVSQIWGLTLYSTIQPN